MQITSDSQRTRPYKKYYAIVNVLCIVNLPSHSDLLSRPPCAGIMFPGFLSSKRRVHSIVRMGGGRSKNTGVVIDSLSRSVFSTQGALKGTELR